MPRPSSCACDFDPLYQGADCSHAYVGETFAVLSGEGRFIGNTLRCLYRNPFSLSIVRCLRASKRRRRTTETCQSQCSSLSLERANRLTEATLLLSINPNVHHGQSLMFYSRSYNALSHKGGLSRLCGSSLDLESYRLLLTIVQLRCALLLDDHLRILVGHFLCSGKWLV